MFRTGMYKVPFPPGGIESSCWGRKSSWEEGKGMGRSEGKGERKGRGKGKEWNKKGRQGGKKAKGRGK